MCRRASAKNWSAAASRKADRLARAADIVHKKVDQTRLLHVYD